MLGGSSPMPGAMQRLGGGAWLLLLYPPLAPIQEEEFINKGPPSTLPPDTRPFPP